MGFLVESCIDEDGVITMNACFVDFIIVHGDFFCNPSRQQITEDTIEFLSNNLRLIKWKKNDVDKDNFILFYEGSPEFANIYANNNTILSEIDKRLYCVVNFEWRIGRMDNNIPKWADLEYYHRQDFVIRNESNNRYHYFESLDSFEELFLIVSGSFGCVVSYPMK